MTSTPGDTNPRRASGALAVLPATRALLDRVEDSILDLAGSVPASHEPRSATPHERVQALARGAARAAAGVSGSAALAPGPFGLVTLLPDLLVVWRLQAQMVADIAAACGRSAELGKEQMLYCLFKHAAAQAFRDVVVRSGERFLVQRAGTLMLQSLAGKIGLKIAQRSVGKAAARFLPLLGAAGVAGYAYKDTLQVAAQAIELFSREIEVREG